MHIKLSYTHFNCPYCGKEHSDTDEKYLKRLAKQKYAFSLIKIKCSCGKRFGMTYNYMGNAVAFK